MILGLDISLSATGWALIEPSGHLLAMGTIKSKPDADRFARFDKILKTIKQVGSLKLLQLVVIEGYSFNSFGKVFDIAELSGIIKYEFWKNAIHFVEIPPNTLKKFVTGKGNSDKNVMMQKAYKQWGIEFADDNACDAFCLAKYGHANYEELKNA